MVLRAVCAVALVILASACEQREEQTGTHSIARPPVAAKSAQPNPVRRPKPANKAVLDSDGVTFDSPAGKTLEYAFGSPQDEVEAMAGEMFGPPQERSGNTECGAGPMVFTRYGPLTLNFQDGKLVGWMAREGAQVVTGDGVRPGIFMRDLKVTRSARMIADSTLEGEFDYLAADGHTIGGFVKGEGRDATVDSLYAGVNCFFR